jgi:hypothetical protein
LNSCAPTSSRKMTVSATMTASPRAASRRKLAVPA